MSKKSSIKGIDYPGVTIMYFCHEEKVGTYSKTLIVNDLKSARPI